MLVTELERGMLRVATKSRRQRVCVLQEIAPHHPRRRTGKSRASVTPPALFFAPLRPFLIDDGADHKRVGRLARVSLEPIWEWIRPGPDTCGGQGVVRRHQPRAGCR